MTAWAKGFVGAVLLIFGAAAMARADQVPLIDHATAEALAGELSGEDALRHLEALARQHRQRGSTGFHAAALHLKAALEAAGLDTVELLQFPTGGGQFYGTQKARPAWNARFAELWLLKQEDGAWMRDRRLADYESMPITLAEDSESGAVTADLVDVGGGTDEADYAGLDVKGKLVLTSSQPGAVQHLAIDRFGAAGIVSYAQNQVTAWWKEDENLIRWGHLDSFADPGPFAFMVSLKQARAFKAALKAGQTVRLEAKVDAGREAGNYDVLTATIKGTDLADQEIAYSCHLDHQRPGANDNASGCVTIFEIARTLAKLIAEGRIEPPHRTLRFIWPPEVEGTMALLNARPDIAGRIKAVIHLDMVGGGPVTKAVFRAGRTPMSLPSIVSDVSAALARFVTSESIAFASGLGAEFPLVAQEGSKDALQIYVDPYSMGSDHDVYMDSSWSIPAIYMNDWPDRYIHTNFDRPANIDPSKLKRVGFIGAAAGLALAGASDGDALWAAMRPEVLRRAAELAERRAALTPAEAQNMTYYHWRRERAAIATIRQFADWSDTGAEAAEGLISSLEASMGAGQPITSDAAAAQQRYRRNAEPKGLMSTFGYSYLTDHLGQDAAANLALNRYGGVATYDALNLADGRSAQDIRNVLSAELGPVPLDAVVEYLGALAKIGVVGRLE